LFAGRLDIARMIKEGGREGSGRRSRLRTVLLVAQGALCVVLLVGAGLFTRSLDNVRDLHLGYDLDKLLVAEWSRRGTPMDATDRVVLRRRMLEAAVASPAIEDGAWISSPPFARGTSTLPLAVPGIDSVSSLGRFTFQIASAGYFDVSGTRIVRGRAFSTDDRLGHAPVVVVSAGMADRLWPGRDAIGQCIKVSWNPAGLDTMPCTTVIGVAENAVHDPGADLPFRYYLPEAQHDIGSSTLLLRTRGEPLAASEEVRAALQAIAPGQVHVTVGVARDLFEAKRRSWMMGATMFGAFGVLALLVAAVGLYGVIAYSVEQRMHELGVRMALGAQPADVRRLVIGEGLRHSLAGVALGVILAAAAAPWIQPLLFDQPARDPLILATVAMLLLGVAFVASLIPATKATRADPNSALRAE
jgi:predicted permease